jgi:hypothetical protein
LKETAPANLFVLNNVSRVSYAPYNGHYQLSQHLPDIAAELLEVFGNYGGVNQVPVCQLWLVVHAQGERGNSSVFLFQEMFSGWHGSEASGS